MSEQGIEVTSNALVHDRRRFGRYTLCYRVAEGGMASVYLALIAAADRRFQKWVAIKVIHPQFARDKRFVAMFLDEARLAAQLRHPNICDIFDFGEADGTYYIVMEYLHGESLSAVMKRACQRTGIPLGVGARIVSDAARGLHAAHELRRPDGTLAEVVHRDVSPQNLFVLYEGVTKVVDFGIAVSRDRLGERTATGELRGKIAYMAPEQLQQKPVDRRADVYALGVVLWEVTVGRRLFKGPTEVDTLVAVLNQQIPRPSEVVSDYPKQLEDIVMKALAREPDDRYPTAGAMARDLDRYLASTGQPWGPAEVADFIQGLFPDRMEARRELLCRGIQETVTIDTELRTAPTMTSSTLPGRLTPVRAREPKTPSVWPVHATSTPEAQRFFRLLHIGVPALVVVAAVTMAWLYGSRYAAQEGPSRNGQRSAAVAVPHTSRFTTDARPVHAWNDGTSLVLLPGPASHDASVAARQSEAIPGAVAAIDDAGSVVRTETERETQTWLGERERLRTRLQTRTRRRPGQSDEVGTNPGYLNVFAVPSATVFEGSTLLGSTPMVRRALSPGRHVLRLVPHDGRPERTIVVEIRTGESRTESVRWP